MWLPRAIRMPMMKIKKEDVPWEEGKDKMKPLKLDTKDDFYFDTEGS